MIYLDSSALLKLVIREAETAALREWLTEQTHPVTSSELAKVEVLIATRRVRSAALPAARAAVASIDLVPLSGVVIDNAAETEQKLRSLDALHLASAALLGTGLTDFVTYDHRLAAAAREVGLPVCSPGASA